MDIRYWLGTWDEVSWNTFLALDPSLEGLKSPSGPSLGDVFINYVKSDGASPGQWVSAERIISEFVHDPHQVYADGVWPYRWRVMPIVVRRSLGQGIAARDLIERLHIFKGLDSRTWGAALRSQGRQLPRHDGELLVQLLAQSVPPDGPG